jgi:hypothetical protein
LVPELPEPPGLRAEPPLGAVASPLDGLVLPVAAAPPPLGPPGETDPPLREEPEEPPCDPAPPPEEPPDCARAAAALSSRAATGILIEKPRIRLLRVSDTERRRRCLLVPSLLPARQDTQLPHRRRQVPVAGW